MARYKRFTFLCNSAERQAIAELALRLQRSQGDAVRYLILRAVRQLAEAKGRTTAMPIARPSRPKRVHS